MNILAFDLGSEFTGVAYMESGSLQWSTTWELVAKRIESPELRWMRFEKNLSGLIVKDRLRIDLVAFEEVRSHRNPKGGYNTTAAHQYGGCRAILIKWCGDRLGKPFVSVTVQEIKTAATGKGGGKGTSKEDVLKAAKARWPKLGIAGYDAADAAFIAVCAHESYSPDGGWRAGDTATQSAAAGKAVGKGFLTGGRYV